MKKVKWINGNHMLFESEHKTFNKQVDCISTGNVIGNVQLSTFVRPYNETKCNSHTFPKGHLQEYDLGWILEDLPSYVKNYIRGVAKNKSVIGYLFKHYSNGRRIHDGYVITTPKHKLLKAFYTDNYKSMTVIDEAIKYITE